MTVKLCLYIFGLQRKTSFPFYICYHLKIGKQYPMCLLQIGKGEAMTKDERANKHFQKDCHQFLHPPSLLPLQHRLELGDSHGRPHVPGRSTKLFRFLRDLLDLTQHLRHLAQHVSFCLIVSDLLTFWFLAFKDSTESSSSRSLMVAD